MTVQVSQSGRFRRNALTVGRKAPAFVSVHYHGARPHQVSAHKIVDLVVDFRHTMLKHVVIARFRLFHDIVDIVTREAQIPRNVGKTMFVWIKGEVAAEDMGYREGEHDGSLAGHRKRPRFDCAI